MISGTGTGLTPSRSNGQSLIFSTELNGWVSGAAADISYNAVKCPKPSEIYTRCMGADMIVCMCTCRFEAACMCKRAAINAICIGICVCMDVWTYVYINKFMLTCHILNDRTINKFFVRGAGVPLIPSRIKLLSGKMLRGGIIKFSVLGGGRKRWFLV